MGYTPNRCAWHFRDKVTSTFFNSRDVIFDETFSNRPFPMDSDDSDEEGMVLAPTAPATPLPNVNAPAPPTMQHCSEHVHLPTAHGQIFQEQLASDHE